MLYHNIYKSYIKCMSSKLNNKASKTIRLGIAMSRKLWKIAKRNAKVYDLTFSEFVRQSIIEKIERAKGDKSNV